MEFEIINLTNVCGFQTKEDKSKKTKYVSDIYYWSGSSSSQVTKDDLKYLKL